MARDVLTVKVVHVEIDRRKKMLPKTGTPPASSRPRLLLQICCAPCGTYITRDRLQSRFEVTWYFCNPNLNSFEEYNKRLAAVKAMAEKFAQTLSTRSVKAIEELKNICSVVPRMDKIAALDMELSIGGMLFARDERKIHMNEVLFLEKLRKKKQ